MKRPRQARRTDAPDSLIVMPTASRSSRPVVTNSTSSFRGARVTDVDDREVLRESTLEDGLAELLEVNGEVERYEEQPPAVTFVDDDGIDRKHTFDFRVFLKCGARIAYAVKAAKRVERSGIRRKLALIQAQVGTRFADEFLLVTEHDLPRSKVFNATLIHHARQVADDGTVAELLTFIAHLRGTFSISDLLEASGHGVEGFVGVVNCIDDGVLKQVSPGRIGLETLVRTSPTTH